MTVLIRVSDPPHFMVRWKGNDVCCTVFLSVRHLNGLRNQFYQFYYYINRQGNSNRRVLFQVESWQF